MFLETALEPKGSAVRRTLYNCQSYSRRGPIDITLGDRTFVDTAHGYTNQPSFTTDRIKYSFIGGFCRRMHPTNEVIDHLLDSITNVGDRVRAMEGGL